MSPYESQRLEIRLSDIYLYPETLRRLGNLANLLDLTLDVGKSIPVPATHTQLPSSSRTNSGMLKRLHIIGTPSSITRVLDDINLASLTTLVIDEVLDNTGSPTKSFWIRCFDQISVCRAIEDIEINQVMHRNENHDHYSLSISWFHSLWTLNNVKSLVINGSAFSCSDEDFSQLARSFPKLKKLVVPPTYYSQGGTLACLFYFSQYCSELSEIDICLQFDIHQNLDIIKNLPQLENHRHPLKELYILSSQLGKIKTSHMIKVALFLDLLFPNLSILEAGDSNKTEFLSWVGIQQIHRALAAARINGFNRAMSEMDSGSI